MTALTLTRVNADVHSVHLPDGSHIGNLKRIGTVWKFKAVGYDNTGNIIPGVFGCMDSIDGRHILNKLSTAYLIPYIDVGVRLDADSKGGIDSIWLAVHTLQPGGSSLKSRRVYDQAGMEAAFLRRTSAEYERLKKQGYVKNVDVDRPAVISVNMQAASMAVNEFLARIHGYRLKPSSEFAVRKVALHDEENSLVTGDGEPCLEFSRGVGRGDQSPFLGMPALGD